MVRNGSFTSSIHSIIDPPPLFNCGVYHIFNLLFLQHINTVNQDFGILRCFFNQFFGFQKTFQIPVADGDLETAFYGE